MSDKLYFYRSEPYYSISKYDLDLLMQDIQKGDFDIEEFYDTLFLSKESDNSYINKADKVKVIQYEDFNDMYIFNEYKLKEMKMKIKDIVEKEVYGRTDEEIQLYINGYYERGNFRGNSDSRERILYVSPFDLQLAKQEILNELPNLLNEAIKDSALEKSEFNNFSIDNVLEVNFEYNFTSKDFTTPLDKPYNYKEGKETLNLGELDESTIDTEIPNEELNEDYSYFLKAIKNNPFFESVRSDKETDIYFAECEDKITHQKEVRVQVPILDENNEPTLCISFSLKRAHEFVQKYSYDYKNSYDFENIMKYAYNDKNPHEKENEDEKDKDKHNDYSNYKGHGPDEPPAPGPACAYNFSNSSNNKEEEKSNDKGFGGGFPPPSAPGPACRNSKGAGIELFA